MKNFCNSFLCSFILTAAIAPSANSCLFNDSPEKTNVQPIIQSFTTAKDLADQGYPVAQNKVGICYVTGTGVAQNYTKAFEYFQMAANQELQEGQYNLGLYHIKFTKDYDKALFYLTLAANQEMKEAQYNLGICYANGLGVSINYPQSFNYFLLAANQGMKEAQYQVGICYINGGIVVKNISKGLRYLKLAGNQGHEESNQEIKRIKSTQIQSIAPALSPIIDEHISKTQEIITPTDEPEKPRVEKRRIIEDVHNKKQRKKSDQKMI